MLTVGAYEAKTHLSDLLDRIEQGEQVLITRHGVPVAILRQPDSQTKPDVAGAIQALRGFRAGRSATGIEIASWVAEGRD